MHKTKRIIFLFIAIGFLMSIGCDDKVELTLQQLQLVEATADNLDLFKTTTFAKPIRKLNFVFSHELKNDVAQNISIKSTTGEVATFVHTFYNNNLGLEITPSVPLLAGKSYEIKLPTSILGSAGNKYDGNIFSVNITNDILTLDSFIVNNLSYKANDTVQNASQNPTISFQLSQDIEQSILHKNITFTSSNGGLKNFQVQKTAPKKYLLTITESIPSFAYFTLNFDPAIGSEFLGAKYILHTNPLLLTDSELLTLVQRQTFKYFWEFGHPVSGLARERNTSGETVTIGGSGFGLMSMIVAVERGFITKNEALDRWETMISFLKNADRFYGVWPHWMNGSTGKVVPFSQKDNGADLVETSFMIQGLITLRQYLNPNDTREANLIKKINEICNAVQYNWFTRGGQNVMYWHWSPNYNWDINHQLRGYNETLITYVMAASSPNYSIPKVAYTSGYARNGALRNGNTYYGYKLPLGGGRGGPLFFTHYSFLGLDPRNLKDEYANYWEQNKNQTLINRAYCIQNPQRFKGYGEKSWGLTASDGNGGYNAFSPDNDRGVITPTAALSSMPYAYEESMTALRSFYYDKGDKLWGPYGFYDAYNESVNWYADSYLAIDQGPIIVMIENHRTQLLWKLFMSAPDVKSGLTKLGFTY